MAKPKDSKIEQCLRRVVREAVAAKDEAISVTKARSRAESELKIGDGFFKSDTEWKRRSENIIRAAFEEEPGATEPAPKKTTSTSQTDETPTRTSKQPKTMTQAEKSNGIVASSEKANASITQAKTPAPEKSKNEDEDDESESNSSEDSGEEDSDRGKRHPEAVELRAPEESEKLTLQVNGVKRRAGERTASEGDSSADEDTSDQTDAEGDERSKPKAKTGSSSGSEGGSEDESSTESESAVLPAILSKRFRPPQGFTAVDSGLLTNNAAFSGASLEGKQIWQITAPSSLSLSSITEVALDAIQSGHPILVHNGAEYVLNEDVDQGDNSAAMLVPTEDGYKRVNQGIERRLQLQQKMDLPNLSARQASQVTGSTAAADIAQASVSSVRPQPKGLRMRYRPPGFGGGTSGKIGSGSESTGDEEQQTTTRPTFQFPKTMGGSTQAVADATVADGNAEHTSKKPKKKRKERHDDKSVAPKVNGVARPSSSSTVNPERSRESSSPDVRRHAPVQAAADTTTETQSSLPNGTTPENSSKAERKKLRRERRESRHRAERPLPAR